MNNNNHNDWSDNVSANSLAFNEAFNSDSSIGNQFSVIQSNTVSDKLVQDYIKLKSKLVILKKAYSELSDVSAQKDKSLRNYEQEIGNLKLINKNY